jgi:hypothetical protein
MMLLVARRGGRVFFGPMGADGLVTHSLSEYRVTFRRMLEIEARSLARVMEGEIGEYPVFATR